MTYIEFFEKSSLENICACLTNAPERVILLGDKNSLMKKHIEIYKEVFGARGYRRINSDRPATMPAPCPKCSYDLLCQ